MRKTTPSIVTIDHLAEFFGKDKRTIQLWSQASEENKNPMPRVSRGKYNFNECVKWRIMFLEDKVNIAENSGDEKLHALKVEGQRIANKERMLKFRRLTTELIPYESARLAWLNETTIFRKNLQSMAPRLTNSLSGYVAPDKVNHVKEKIYEQIHEVLTRLSELKINLTDAADFEEEEDLPTIKESLTVQKVIK